MRLVCLSSGAANPASIEGVLPVILLTDGSLITVGLSAPIGAITAQQSVGCAVVVTEDASWDSVKSLYR